MMWHGWKSQDVAMNSIMSVSSVFPSGEWHSHVPHKRSDELRPELGARSFGGWERLHFNFARKRGRRNGSVISRTPLRQRVCDHIISQLDSMDFSVPARCNHHELAPSRA